jgi:hypothetical protein
LSIRISKSTDPNYLTRFQDENYLKYFNNNVDVAMSEENNETEETSTNPNCFPLVPSDFVNEIPSLQSSTINSVPCKGFIKKVGYFDT